jgi:hypothetical protein
MQEISPKVFDGLVAHTGNPDFALRNSAKENDLSFTEFMLWMHGIVMSMLVTMVLLFFLRLTHANKSISSVYLIFLNDIW